MKFNKHIVAAIFMASILSSGCLAVQLGGGNGDKVGTLEVTGDLFTTGLTDYSASSTIVGWSSFTVKKLYYKKIGKMYFIYIDLRGTSNSTSTNFTMPDNMPTPASYIFGGSGWCVDNGVTGAAPPCFQIYSDTNAIAVVRYITGTWTASGQKEVHGQFWMECK